MGEVTDFTPSHQPVTEVGFPQKEAVTFGMVALFSLHHVWRGAQMRAVRHQPCRQLRNGTVVLAWGMDAGRGAIEV